MIESIKKRANILLGVAKNQPDWLYHDDVMEHWCEISIAIHHLFLSGMINAAEANELDAYIEQLRDKIINTLQHD